MLDLWTVSVPPKETLGRVCKVRRSNCFHLAKEALRCYLTELHLPSLARMTHFDHTQQPSNIPFAVNQTLNISVAPRLILESCLMYQSSHICTSVVREYFTAFCRPQTAGTHGLWANSWVSASFDACKLRAPLGMPDILPAYVHSHFSTLVGPSQWSTQCCFGPTAARFLWKVFGELWQHVKDKRGRNWLYLPSACLCWLCPREQPPSLLNSPILLHVQPQKLLAHPDLECQTRVVLPARLGHIIRSKSYYAILHHVDAKPAKFQVPSTGV